MKDKRRRSKRTGTYFHVLSFKIYKKRKYGIIANDTNINFKMSSLRNQQRPRVRKTVIIKE